MISIEKANALLEGLNEKERIHWAYEQFSGHLVLTTSFGTYAAVMLHLVTQTIPHPVVISVDTGHNRETREFSEQLCRQLNLHIERYRVPDFSASTASGDESPEDYLQRSKVSILERALREHGARAWMSGVQRNETDHRKDFEFLMQRADGLYKFHPLLDWNTRMLFAYCKEHGLPLNDHYFDPSKGEDQKQECGIHLTGMANESFTSSEL